MSSAKQNHSIARLIVGAMSIDGSLDKKEREKVAKTLDTIGMPELIADVGAAIEEAHEFNMFEECKSLIASLGPSASEMAPIIFHIVTDVIAMDRFMSADEAAYLSALARQLGLDAALSRNILKLVMAERRGRLQISAKDVDSQIHPHLKELLSFEGAEQLVGEVQENSLEDLLQKAEDKLLEGAKVSLDEVERALTILGLSTNSTLEEAEAVWTDTIENLDLPKMARLGETFVSAAINRISRINSAYKVILQFHEAAGTAHK